MPDKMIVHEEKTAGKYAIRKRQAKGVGYRRRIPESPGLGAKYQYLRE
jgi:hypothetical protein